MDTRRPPVRFLDLELRTKVEPGSRRLARTQATGSGTCVLGEALRMADSY